MVDGDYLSNYLQIERIGKGYIAASDRWNGLTRTDAPNSCVFQYTISGTGTLRIGENIHKINPGQAFAVVIPSDHEYYRNELDDSWEILYIILRGEWAKQLFREITGNIGSIFNISGDSELINMLSNIYERVKQREVKDLFDAANLAYLFVMEFYKMSLDVVSERYPALVRRAIEFMKCNYSKPINIESIARELGITKAHLIRVFTQSVGISPGQHLIKMRLDYAVTLLLNSNDSLDEIAAITGFSGGNYLGKTLRQHLGMSTKEFRRKQSITPIIV
jgi:AraC-like DNA-binding protein